MTMNLTTVGMCVVIGIIIGLIFLIVAYVFFKGILMDYKQMAYPLTVEELYATVDAMISFEIQALENDKFEQFGNSLNSQSFENYYQYLTRRVLNDLSKPFMYRASFIMSEDALVDLICKNIMNYLKTRLANGDPDDSN